MSLGSVLIDATLRMSVVLVAALAATVLLRRRSAALRHFVLAVAVLCSAALPLLQGLAPSWQLPGAVRSAASIDAAGVATDLTIRLPGSGADPATSGAAARASAAPAVWPDARRWLLSVWIVAAAIQLLVLLAGTARIQLLLGAATPVLAGPWHRAAVEIVREYAIGRPVAILQSAHPTLLVTWGFLRPRIVLPAAARHWQPERIRIVLRHELAHVERADWLVQMVAELLRALFWFNPLLWMVARRLRQESELACDDAVIDRGVSRTDYAEELLGVARSLARPRRLPFLAPAMARPSSLRRRIAAMLNAKVDRHPTTSSARLATIVALGLLTLAVATAQSAQSPFATLSGTITDQTGGYLPDVAVTMSNAASRAKYEVRTDPTGRFEFVALPGGEYTIEASQPGFKRLIDTITVSARQALSRDLTLQVGSLQETITVIGGTERAQAVARAPRAVIAMPSPPVCAQAATGGHMGGSIKQPMKIRDVRPIYPDSLRQTAGTGVVKLNTIIGTDGLVKEIEVAETPHPDLATAAANAVSQWQFTPTYLNCVAVEVPMGVSVNFGFRPD
jgi:beta-lactamase regulating signal transducer with metallopeptidase domain